MGCIESKKNKETPIVQDFTKLASETHFSLSEVEALHELYKKLSSSLVDNGYIQKEELMLALFRSSNKKSLFADRIFDLFDINRNGHIDFGEFVRSLSIFHPRTPETEKLHLKQMVLALLTESDLNLSDDIVEAIVDKTFKEVDKKGDGRIDEEEWKKYAAKNPSLLRNMTLPYLIDADESKLAKKKMLESNMIFCWY